MKKLLVSSLAVICLAILVITVPGNAETEEESKKSDLTILYAGHPDSAREKDFVQFLGKHFTEVKTGDLAKFTEEQAEGFDVVILDYDGDGFKAPRPRLSRQYTRSTITVGVVGGLFSSSMRLRTGYS